MQIRIGQQLPTPAQHCHSGSYHESRLDQEMHEYLNYASVHLLDIHMTYAKETFKVSYAFDAS